MNQQNFYDRTRDMGTEELIQASLRREGSKLCLGVQEDREATPQARQDIIAHFAAQDDPIAVRLQAEELHEIERPQAQTQQYGMRFISDSDETHPPADNQKRDWIKEDLFRERVRRFKESYKGGVRL